MSIARILMIMGIALFAIGGLVYLAARLGLPFGSLPGDIRIERDNFTCVFPMASMILVSILLSLLLSLVVRLLNR